MITLQKENERVEKTLEPALPGVNTLLRKAVKIDSKVARVSVSSTWCSSVVFEREDPCHKEITRKARFEYKRNYDENSNINARTQVPFGQDMISFAMGIFVKSDFSLHVA